MPQLASSCVPEEAGAVGRGLCKVESQLVAPVSSANIAAVEPKRLSRAGPLSIVKLFAEAGFGDEREGRAT